MTRRGSLAYYLAAWVIGGFVVALGWWSSAGDGTVSGFLIANFFALVAGAVDLILFAFLLRQVLRWSGTHSVVVWAVTGAALFFSLLALLTMISGAFSGILEGGGPFFIGSILFSGPDALAGGGFWPAPIEGAALAMVLCLVDRAFDRPVEPEPQALQAATQAALPPAAPPMPELESEPRPQLQLPAGSKPAEPEQEQQPVRGAGSDGQRSEEFQAEPNDALPPES